MNSGQACLAGTRLLVPRARMEEAHTRIVEAFEALKVGDPREADTVIGPMVSRSQYERVQAYIRKGVDDGARLLIGGPGRPDGIERGYFVRPTVFGNVRKDMNHSATARLLWEVHRRFATRPEAKDDIQSALPWLRLIRRTSPTEVGRGMLQPSMCLIVQGEKEILVGERLLRYGPGDYVQAGVAMPVAGRVLHATRAEPYYGIRVELDPKEIAALILETGLMPTSDGDEVPLVCAQQASEGLTEAFVRLMYLLDRPADLPVLGRLLKQEMIYYLLTLPGGLSLGQGVSGGKREQAVSIGATPLQDAKEFRSELLAP